jgi:glycosyltransferase involved in cell wall biosynthesis
MLVGLNLVYLVPGETGGRETYARELVPALQRASSELQFAALVNRDAGAGLADELGERVRPVVVPISARNRGRWAIGEVALVARAAQRARVRLLHSMANFAPVWGRFARVLTIHDLHYMAVPDLLAWPVRVGTSVLVGSAARRADRIIAVSGAGRDEITAGLGVARDRIDVVPNGVRPPPASAPTTGLRERHHLARRAVALSVATDLPHKNLRSLIAALALIAPDQRPVLLMAGHGTDAGMLARQAEAAGVDGDVRLLGRCSLTELESLYALADCAVFPTLHEGFGLPVLEAMARSVPVLCSDIPALREVAAENALYFDPRSPGQIAQRIQQVIADEALARKLRELGPLRAAAFSWQAAAEGTLASYRRALAA